MRRQTPVSPDLLEDPSGYCILGADTLLRQIQALENQIEGVRKNDDIEFMHKLRVTSRRMRAALGLFEECFPKKTSKKWMKGIKKVTRSSGAARDADVQLTFLENYSRSVQDRNALPGLAYLVTLQKARRAGMQSDVVSVLDALDGSNILTDIATSSMTILRNLPDEVNLSESIIRTLSTYEKARDHILTRLDEVLALEGCVHVESAAAKHHELRIAAKRLRYTMEIFSSLYKEELKEQISLMKQLQDVLGEIHDYDVWAQEFSLMQSMPDDARCGTSNVLNHSTEMRKSRYRDFVSLWDNAVAKGLFDNIRHVTETRPNSDAVREYSKRDNPTMPARRTRQRESHARQRRTVRARSRA